MRSIDATTLTLSVSWPVLAAIGAGLVIMIVAATYLVRPRVRVQLASAVAGPAVRSIRGQCGEARPLGLRVRLKRLSFRRSAAEIELTVQAISDVRLHVARYGPAQELTSRDVKNGKGTTRSMSVGGIKIDKWEPTPFEDVELWITVPVRPGKYLAWTTSFTHAGAGGTGITRFVFTVKGHHFRLRRVTYVGTWRLRLLRWFASPNPHDLPPFPSLVRANWWSEPSSPPLSARMSEPPDEAPTAAATRTATATPTQPGSASGLAPVAVPPGRTMARVTLGG